MNPLERPGRWPVRTACLLLVLPLGELPAAEDALAAGLAACSAVTDAGQRLACFDSLVESISERHTAGMAKQDDATEEHAIPPLPDSVGRPSDDEDGPAEEYAGRVESCEKSDTSGRWYFTFDNGQVWRQSNTGRLPFRDCDFAVTLRRDVFGYKLEIPSENRSVRVTRVR